MGGGGQPGSGKGDYSKSEGFGWIGAEPGRRLPEAAKLEPLCGGAGSGGTHRLEASSTHAGAKDGEGRHLIHILLFVTRPCALPASPH